MNHNATRKLTAAVGAIIAGLALGMIALPSAHAATARNGVCETGEFCLYYAANETGSLVDFVTAGGSVPDLTPYKFVGTGSGKGQAVRNNAHSVRNKSTQTVTVYYSPNYGGASQTFAPGASGNLSSALVNNEASFRVGAPASTTTTLGQKVANAATTQANANLTQAGAIKLYNTYFGTSWGNSTPWCAIFASDVLHQAGMSTKAHSAAADYFNGYSPSFDKTYFTWIPAGSTPRPGDIAVWNWDGALKSTDGQHVNIVVSATSAYAFTFVTGNSPSACGTAGSVCQASYSASQTKQVLMGFARPIA